MRIFSSVAATDFCNISGFSILNWNQTLSCDNHKGSFLAKDCTVHMKGDKVFEKNITCNGGIFFTTNITMDSTKVSQCQAYHYIEVSFSG